MFSHSLFKAELSDTGGVVLVNFCEKYSEAAHQALAKVGLAPVLHHFAVLKGGINMVVMELLKGWTTAYTAFINAELPSTVVN